MADELPLEEVFERFEAALAFFRARTPMPASAFYALTDQARLKAFTVSNVAQMQVVQQVLDSLDHAIDQGQDLESWRKEIGPALRAAWAGDVENPAWRLQTIFRTNLQTAFAHGRTRQMRDPAVTRLRPFWLFDATVDWRTTEECSARDGVLLPADDPWWRKNQPPIHHGCRSGIRSLRKAQADRRGGVNPPDREVELNPPGKGFGAAPSLDPAIQVTPYVPEVKGHPALEGARLRKERDFAEAEERRKAAEAAATPERRLLDSRVTSQRRIGVGINEPKLVALQHPDGTVQKAVFKPQAEIRHSEAFATGLARREAAAVELDRLLGGPEVVPATVVGDMGAGFGSYQSFIPKATPIGGVSARATALRDHLDTEDPRLRKTWLLDVISGNGDRHGANLLARKVSGATELWAIDNGFAFPSTFPGNFAHATSITTELWRMDDSSATALRSLDLGDLVRVARAAGASHSGVMASLVRAQALRVNQDIISDVDGPTEFLRLSFEDPPKLGLTAEDLALIERAMQ